MKNIIYLFISICFIFLHSCETKREFPVEFNKTFTEMKDEASKYDVSFCILLSKASCSACELFLTNLYDDNYASLRKNVIFNVVDIASAENKWYEYLIASSAAPTTLLFSSTGELITIISGGGKMSLDALQKAVNDDIVNSQHLYKSRFPAYMSYDEIIETLNLIISAKNKIDQKMDGSSEIDQSMEKLYYPYNLYLKILDLTNKGDIENSIELAKQMLTFQDPIYATIYADLYLKSRFIINPHFKLEDAPVLDINTQEIDLGSCKLGDSKKIKVKLANTGKEDLIIYNIIGSCNCIHYNGKTNFVMKSKESIDIEMKFTADVAGYVERNIVITTNEINPRKIINVFANILEK